MVRRPIVCIVAGLFAVAPAGSEPPVPTEPQPAESTEPRSDAAVPRDQPTGQTGSEFERRLAELSFAEFLGTELGVNTSLYACTEPESPTAGTPILCFAAVGDPIGGDLELLVATSVVSGGTGLFTFDLVDAASPSPPASSGPPAPPIDTTVVTEQRDPTITAANAAVLAAGEEINETSATFVEQYLADVRITAVDVYEFDATTATVTLSVRLAADVTFTADDLAWGHTEQFAGRYWAVGTAFRSVGATVQPGFTLIVDGAVYASDYTTMTSIADGTITRDDWLATVAAE